MNEADQSPTRLLLADANILIDLAQAGGLGLIGDLIRFGLAEIFVPRVIYDEVSTEVSETQVVELGITILPVSVDLSRRVLEYPDRALSRPDRTLLLLAMEAGYGVWSNDRRLRSNCVDKGVAVYWEFQLLGELVKTGRLAKRVLVELARKVETINVFQKGVADDLEKKL